VENVGILSFGQEFLKGGAELFESVFNSIAEKSPLKKVLRRISSVYRNHTVKYHSFLDEEVFGKAIQFVSNHDTAESLRDAIKKEKEANKGQCSNDDPTPQCVIEKALCSYEKYVGVLFYASGAPQIGNILQSGQRSELGSALDILQEQDAALLLDAQDSKIALNTAMAVYSNFFQTYQIHLKLKEVIAALVKVRNRTSYLTELVSCIPDTFVGIATTKCD
jgi:hypothetical protein